VEIRATVCRGCELEDPWPADARTLNLTLSTFYEFQRAQ
jgi:hypothetical protein